jgi:hypothetical protein
MRKVIPGIGTSAPATTVDTEFSKSTED